MTKTIEAYEDFLAFASLQTAAVREIVMSVPMRDPSGARVCYRDARFPSLHYAIAAYAVGRKRVWLVIIGGRDSDAPGLGVEGVEPSYIVPCGCGAWQPATAEQLAHTEREVNEWREAMLRARGQS